MDWTNGPSATQKNLTEEMLAYVVLLCVIASAVAFRPIGGRFAPIRQAAPLKVFEVRRVSLMQVGLQGLC